MSEQKTFLVMAGGTGGHVFPALATARYLEENGAKVHWLGSVGGMEVDLIAGTGIPMTCISVSGLRGKGKLSLLAAPYRLLNSLFQAAVVIGSVKPDCVVGMGGFVSGPGGLAARMMGKPLVIHEQNAIAGMTNRILSKFANRVMEAFPNSFPKGTTTIVTGNPVRKEICGITSHALKRKNDEKVRLLVVGGSLGAVAINQAVPEAISLMSHAKQPEIMHQTGKRNFDETVTAYEKVGVTASIIPFISDMKEAYEWADIVVCRAGALTISELCAAGVGAVLIPYPHAVDDHQTKNAGYMVDAGAAKLMQQSELTAKALYEELNNFTENKKIMTEMAQAANKLAKPDATETVADHCMEACHG